MAYFEFRNICRSVHSTLYLVEKKEQKGSAGEKERERHTISGKVIIVRPAHSTKSRERRKVTFLSEELTVAIYTVFLESRIVNPTKGFGLAENIFTPLSVDHHWIIHKAAPNFPLLRERWFTSAASALPSNLPKASIALIDPHTTHPYSLSLSLSRLSDRKLPYPLDEEAKEGPLLSDERQQGL